MDRRDLVNLATLRHGGYVLAKSHLKSYLCPHMADLFIVRPHQN